ncbi:precorrin-6A reductase [Thalassorhabdus alkalitolerans]|uniref:Precorrin-6A reductase n=1 Tax=Thalassorhabdus alkalitolerans TaxID=2282697 RepID=A0ABW0YL24_9BACI|nr:precorrin-6A reductase [Thalassobacillus sp. C254]
MIFFLAGTSDARELAVKVKKDGYKVLASVVTEEAAKELEKEDIQVRTGRLDVENMEKVFYEEEISLIVDASHPFAEEASKNAIEAAQNSGLHYIRYERASINTYDKLVVKVESYQEAAEFAAKRGGNIMLTTGSKTLDIFAKRLIGLDGVRLVCRMLPRIENMEKCKELGVEQKNIIALQGPFTKDLNKALYEQFGITTMITKESGKRGSFDEKVTSALELGIEVILIERPDIYYGDKGSTTEEILNKIESSYERGTEKWTSPQILNR